MRNIKKILPRAALLLAFVIFLEWGLGFLYRPYDQYSTYANMEYKALKGTVDTIFCGSSKTYSSFDPAVYDEALGTVSFNMGTGSQALTSTYDIIKDAFRLNPIKTVYLEVSLPTLQGSGSDLSRIGAFDRVVSIPGKIEALFREKKSGVQIRELLYSTRITNYFDFSSIKENVSYKLSEKRNTPPQDGTKAHYIYRGFINNDRVYSGKRYKNKTIHTWKPQIHTQENVDLLKQIIELCQDEGAEIILFSPPMPELLLSYAGDMNDMHAYYQSIADEFGLRFFDMNFCVDKNTVFPQTAFRDFIHLNRSGAEICTSLAAEICESGDDYQSYFTPSYEGAVAKE